MRKTGTWQPWTIDVPAFGPHADPKSRRDQRVSQVDILAGNRARHLVRYHIESELLNFRSRGLHPNGVRRRNRQGSHWCFMHGDSRDVA